MASVTVTLIAPDGQRHAVTVKAKSLYAAIFEYNYLSHVDAKSLPRPDRSSVFEVQREGGLVRRVTYGVALDWANRVAEERARIAKAQRR
jgi:hypothetical protein